MSRKDIITFSFVAAIIVAIVFLSIKNDCLFNKEKGIEEKRIEEQDSIALGQMNGLINELKGVAIQMDSVQATQKKNSETESQHYKNIKYSLDQIKRTQRQLLNNTK